MRWKGPQAPTAPAARLLGPPQPRSTPPSPGRVAANPGRLGAHLPERRHPRMTCQPWQPCRELSARSLTFASSRTWISATGSGISLRAGSPSLAACKISSPAKEPCARGRRRFFRLSWRWLTSSTGSTVLPPGQGTLSTGCPPVHPQEQLRTSTARYSPAR
jgi:hypothetical protein